jgi:hypothetical protein
MDQVHVEVALIQVHKEIQVTVGDPTPVQPTTCPLRDLPGFDSVLIPVTLRRVARTLGISLPPDHRFPNLYVTSDGKQRQSIAQVAAGFLQHLARKAAA